MNYSDLIDALAQCLEAYGERPTDVANYGAVPPCQTFGHVRCIRFTTTATEMSRRVKSSSPEGGV